MKQDVLKIGLMMTVIGLVLLSAFLTPSCKKEADDTLVALKPDLIVTRLKVTQWDSSSMRYSFTIKNIGSYAAYLDGPTDEEWDNICVQAYISTDSIFDTSNDQSAGGTILGYSPLGYLHRSATMDGEWYCNFYWPNNPPNYHYIILLVDCHNFIAEENEDNNFMIARYR